MNEFSKTFEVRWADLDPNFHMRHTAYNDYAAHVRFSFLNEKGFTMNKFREIGIGPVLFNERTDFFREVRSGDLITVNVKLAGASSDGRKFRMRHEVTMNGKEKAAAITVEGAWLDVVKRKIVIPPAELIALTKELIKTEDFSEM